MPQVSTHPNNLSIVVEKLCKEVGVLRSFLIGMAGKDREGNYNPKFVDRVLKLSQSDHEYIFENREKFLEQLRK